MVMALAFAASVCFAAAYVLQYHEAHEAPRGLFLSPRLLLELAHHRIWLGGIAAMMVGNGLQAWALGTGSLDRGAFGGQERGATNLYGIGVRFSTNPTSTGFLAEIGLGYRDFRAYWSDGTELAMTSNEALDRKTLPRRLPTASPEPPGRSPRGSFRSRRTRRRKARPWPSMG